MAVVRAHEGEMSAVDPPDRLEQEFDTLAARDTPHVEDEWLVAEAEWLAERPASHPDRRRRRESVAAHDNSVERDAPPGDLPTFVLRGHDDDSGTAR